MKQSFVIKTISFIILLVLVISSISAIAYFKNELTLNIKLDKIFNSINFINTGKDSSSQKVVWDNGMNYDEFHASQRDEQFPFSMITADDFQFENETIVNIIYWVGAYWKDGADDFDMEIIFYYDRGDGNAPGDIYAGPYYFLNSEVNQTLIETRHYEYYTTLAEPVIFIENQRFWISIQAVGIYPPQWGIAAHDSLKLHDCVFKCELLGYPEWTSSRIVFGSYSDIAFQLIQRENNPPSTPIIEGPNSGNPDTEYCFTFHSTDPDGDNVKYLIDWGYGTTIETNYYPSCEPVELCHTWSKGDYVIRAMTIDEWGDESEWSEHEITIPRTRASFLLWYDWLLEHFPILDRLIGLIK